MRQLLPLHDAPPPAKLRLQAHMRPVRRYQIREEAFGYVLMRGNAIVPVRLEAWDILQSLDGATTLQQIKQTFGAPGLALIGMLYLRGLVEMLL